MSDASKCDPDADKYKWALFAFVGLFVYSAILLLGMALFLVVYRPYLRYMFRKKPNYKPGVTMDETMTTVGMTEASVMTTPSKRDKNDKKDKNDKNDKGNTKSPNKSSKSKKK